MAISIRSLLVALSLLAVSTTPAMANDYVMRGSASHITNYSLMGFGNIPDVGQKFSDATLAGCGILVSRIKIGNQHAIYGKMLCGEKQYHNFHTEEILQTESDDTASRRQILDALKDFKKKRLTIALSDLLTS